MAAAARAVDAHGYTATLTGWTPVAQWTADDRTFVELWG
jgi:hypothetical protein